MAGSPILPALVEGVTKTSQLVFWQIFQGSYVLLHRSCGGSGISKFPYVIVCVLLVVGIHYYSINTHGPV